MFKCIRCQAEINVDYKACPFCGEPITDFVRRYSQESLDGKYRLVGRLGAGGMGEVFRAEHMHLHTTRVIKLMRPNLSVETNATERFLREARLATRIHHPNVATLHDFSTLPDGSYYMVWEYIEGKNLTEVMRRDGAFSPRRAAILGVQILLGLEAVHRAGIIHRDISPDNVMLSTEEDGTERAKIIDLGIAKQGDEVASHTQTGIFIGKLKYCSPEHLGILPEGEKMDGRADLYSFGIVLYEMVAGAPPFADETPQQYILSHAKKPPRPLRQVNPKIDDAPELEAVIFKALEKDREKRYSSAREFAQALENIIPSLIDTPLLSDKTLYVPIAGASDTTQVTPSPDVRRVPTTVEGTRPAGNDQTLYLGGPATGARAAVTDTSNLSRDTYVVPPAGSNVSRDTYVVPSTPVAQATEPGVRKSGGIGKWIALGMLLLALIAGSLYFALTRDRAPVKVAENTTTTATGITTTTVASPTVPTTTVAPNSSLTVEGAPLTTDTTATTTAPATDTTATTAPPATTTAGTAPRPTPKRPVPPVTTTTTATVAEPPPPEPTPPVQGGFARGKGKAFVESKDYSSGFSRGILPDYNALTQGDAVQWSWVAPGVNLANHNIRVGRWRNLSGYETNAINEFLTGELQSQIDDVASGSSTLTAEGAVVWAGNDKGLRSKRGMMVEMLFREGSGRVVAMMRHRIYENNPEDAAEEMPEAIVEFIESNR